MLVSTIILNWKSPNDTIDCLKSILSTTSNVNNVIIVDNDSQDNSMEVIRHFLLDNGLSFNELCEDDIQENSYKSIKAKRITLVTNNGNHGYAGGNNIGIQHALDFYQPQYLWLVNNDATVANHALDELLGIAKSDDKIGFVGSVILYQERPDIIQCYGGGKLYPLLGKSKLYKKDKPASEIESADCSQLDFIMGASLLVRVDVITDIGLMDESYFMYAEELDWQRRAALFGWKISVADKSYIYHAGQGSTKNHSHMYYYYINRSGVMLRRRYFNDFVVYIAAMNVLLYTVLKNIKDMKSIKFGIKGIMDGLKWNWKKDYRS